MVLVALGIAVVARPCVALEYAKSGSDLIEACRAAASGSQPTTAQAGVCVGEVSALAWLAPGQISDVIRSCVPDNVSPQQTVQAVVNYLDRNQDRLHEPFEGLALEALAQRWPCHNNSNGTQDSD
jgi:hypothetical protein